MFNTLKYAKILEEVGFTRDQSEMSVKILVEIMEDKLASKQDLQELQVALRQDVQNLGVSSKQDLQDLRVEIQKDFQEFRITTKHDIQELRVEIQQMKSDVQHSIVQLESKLTIRMGTMLAASIAILTAIQKLI